MLLPHMALRETWLKHAVRYYPVYDPPHKVEERVLPKEQAQENFDYFMRVRRQRLEYFTGWLRRYFLTRTQADERGVRALNRWAVRYAGLLLPDRRAERGYFSYDPPWTGDYAGCNVVFDMGIALGEFMIANCPKLRWDMDPISALRPKLAKAMKAEFGTSFQRPEITGFDNPNWRKSVLHFLYIYTCQMRHLTTWKGIRRFYRRHRSDRQAEKRLLYTLFDDTLKEYRAGDPTRLYGTTGYPADLEDDDE